MARFVWETWRDIVLKQILRFYQQEKSNLAYLEQRLTSKPFDQLFKSADKMMLNPFWGDFYRNRFDKKHKKPIPVTLTNVFWWPGRKYERFISLLRNKGPVDLVMIGSQHINKQTVYNTEDRKKEEIKRGQLMWSFVFCTAFNYVYIIWCTEGEGNGGWRHLWNVVGQRG